MYIRLSPDKKLELIQKVLAGQHISQLCREESISRTVLYKWLNQYEDQLQLGKNPHLRSKVKKGNSHWKSFDPETKYKIKKLALKYPDYSPRQLAHLVHASPNGVWRVLKVNALNTSESRLNHLSTQGTLIYRKINEQEKVFMIEKFRKGCRVKAICEESNVSRTIFY